MTEGEPPQAPTTALPPTAPSPLDQASKKGSEYGAKPDTAERPERNQDNAEIAPPTGHGGPGLVLLAGRGDSLAGLYSKVYRGMEPPPYSVVASANREPIVPGSLVVFPEPPNGWLHH